MLRIGVIQPLHVPAPIGSGTRRSHRRRPPPTPTGPPASAHHRGSGSPSPRSRSGRAERAAAYVSGARSLARRLRRAGAGTAPPRSAWDGRKRARRTAADPSRGSGGCAGLTAATESKPSSLKARRLSTAVAETSPKTAAASVHTSSSTMLSRSPLGHVGRRIASASSSRRDPSTRSPLPSTTAADPRPACRCPPPQPQTPRPACRCPPPQPQTPRPARRCPPPQPQTPPTRFPCCPSHPQTPPPALRQRRRRPARSTPQLEAPGLAGERARQRIREADDVRVFVVTHSVLCTTRAARARAPRRL